jgi:hypothetical protein
MEESIMQDNGGRGSRPLDQCVTAALKSAFADLDFRVHVISDICYESQNILQQIGRVLIHIPLPGISLAVTAARDLYDLHGPSIIPQKPD